MTDEMTARALRTSWRAAEQSLYAIGGGDVERYERAVKLVRAVVEELADVESSAELADRWPDATEHVERAVVRSGLSLGSLPLDQVAGAGFALRQAALHVEEARRARAQSIAVAREGGNTWVVLHETSDPLADPGGSIRMHVESGLAIVAGVAPDPDTGALIRTLTIVTLDANTGDLVDPDPGLADATYADASSFRSGEAALRDLVERVAGESVSDNRRSSHLRDTVGS